jgi:hypothetical protein
MRKPLPAGLRVTLILSASTTLLLSRSSLHTTNTSRPLPRVLCPKAGSGPVGLAPWDLRALPGVAPPDRSPACLTPRQDGPPGKAGGRHGPGRGTERAPRGVGGHGGQDWGPASPARCAAPGPEVLRQPLPRGAAGTPHTSLPPRARATASPRARPPASLHQAGSRGASSPSADGRSSLASHQSRPPCGAARTRDAPARHTSV